MKLAIVGSRDFTDYGIMCEYLKKYSPSTVISGGARGADTLAERWARENNIPCTVYEADWERLGKAAGKIRNSDIVSAADRLIAFWDYVSPGTHDSIKKANKKGIPVEVVNINQPQRQLPFL